MFIVFDVLPEGASASSRTTQSKDRVECLVYRKIEAAEALRVSRWAIDRLIEAGELATSRAASLTVIPADEVKR